MTPAFSQMNWTGTALASLLHFVMGGLWFVVLFHKPYGVALGLDPQSAAKPGALFIMGPFVCSAVTVATTAFLMAALHLTTYGDALVLGTVVGIGYLGAMTMNIAINPLFPHPFRYALINVPFFLGGSLMACAVLVMTA